MSKRAMAKQDTVQVFDTTLRDGEQSPSVYLQPQEKVDIARIMDAMGTSVIEAGFPVASEGEMEAVKRVSSEVHNSTVAALARAIPADVEAAAEAVAKARQPRIHVFMSTSPLHLKHMLQMDEQQVIERSVKAVEKARGYVDDVEFSAQDASRSDPAFLVEIFSAAIEAGARVINIPDTVGYATPREFGQLVRDVKAQIARDDVTISVHCHNDLGLGVANTLAAVEAGARQVEVTVNGIGERAGNASAEEVIMALKTRADHYGTRIDIDTRYLHSLSKLVAQSTGMVVQPNKAVVGSNAFAHESGIHQDGVLQEPQTYEIMKPQDVGHETNRMVLGKHSGRHALHSALSQMGYELEGQQLNQVFREFKKLAEQQQVTAVDLRSLAENSTESAAWRQRWRAYQ